MEPTRGIYRGFDSQIIGKINEKSEGLTLKDIMDYKSSSYISKLFTKISLAVQGKGWVDSESISRIIDNLGQKQLKELVAVLDEHVTATGATEVRSMLLGKIKKDPQKDPQSDKIYKKAMEYLQNIEPNQAISDEVANAFNANPYENLQADGEKLESFMTYLLEMEEEGSTDESVKGLVDFAKLRAVTSEDGSISKQIGSIVKEGNIEKFAGLLKSYVDSDSVLTDGEISNLGLSDYQLDQMSQGIETEELKIQEDARASEAKLQKEANKPPRGQELAKLVTVINRGFNEITNRKWDYLENNIPFKEKLQILGYEDASTLREVLTQGNANLDERRRFLGDFLKRIESSLRGNDEVEKQAAKSVLGIINYPRLAAMILDLKQEVVAESMQEVVAEPQMFEVPVANSAAMTKIADRMKDSIIKTIQTSGSSEPFENVEYEINSLYFEPRIGTGVIYEANDLISLTDNDPESFDDFVVFVTHLNTLLKSEDADQRETAETIISGLGGDQLLSDMKDL